MAACDTVNGAAPCEILMIVCNPKGIMAFATIEMERARHLAGISIMQHASQRSLRQTVVQLQPRHLHIVCHTVKLLGKPVLLFDDDADHGSDSVRPTSRQRLVRLISELRQITGSRLESVCLNGCLTLEDARALVRAGLPAAVGWVGLLLGSY